MILCPKKARKAAIPAALAAAAFALLCPRPSAADIVNHSAWKDTQGNLVDCHEGGILRVGNTFYWYGRAYKGNVDGIYGSGGAPFRCGINCYSSTDLTNWTYRGAVLSYPASGFLTAGTWHRPRVLYNAATGKYVLYFFMFPTGTAAPSTMVVATSTTPTGPFTVLTGPDFRPAGDLALFQDADGQGYIAYDDNRSVRVTRLTADFLNLTGSTTVALQAGGGKYYEGSSMVRYKGKYIVAGSGVAGLNPTDTTYAVADAPLGPYTNKGLMSQQNTWSSQISSFFYLAESDRVIVLCEQWLIGPNGERVPAEQSCQLWLPMTFDPATGVAQMHHVSQWDPWATGGGVPPPPPPPAPSLVGHWKLDETAGASAADSSGKNNHGSFVGSPTWTAGRLANGLRFDGADDRVSCGVNGMPAPNAAQTHAFWLRYDAIPGSAQAAVVLSGASSGVFSGFHNLDGTGMKLGTWRFGGPFLAKTDPPPSGSWHHLAYAFDGTTHRLYLDGSPVDSSTVGPHAQVPTSASLGGLPWGGEFFKGDLDDVRIYNYALTEAQIRELAQAAAPANAPPTVSLSSPANGASFAAPAAVDLAADASDPDGAVQKVEFFQGGTKLGEDTAAPYAFSWTSVAAGTYVLTARATDNAGAATTSAGVTITVQDGSTPPPPPPPPPPPQGGGAVLREYWTGIPGTSVTDLISSPAYPRNPSGSDTLSSFEAPSDWADDYGTRLRAYVTAPADGSYVFWIAGDDNCRLWVSTDDNPAHKVLVATVDGWTSPREWTKFASQQTAPIPLVAGRRYYVEAQHKEGNGLDNVSVGWRLPDGTLERPIPGSRLAAVDPLDGDGDGVSDADEIAAGADPGDKTSVPGAPAGGNPISDDYNDHHGADDRCGATGIEGLLAIGVLLLRRRLRRPV